MRAEGNRDQQQAVVVLLARIDLAEGRPQPAIDRLAQLTQPGVFIGYMPGEVDAPLAAPAPASPDPGDRLLEEIIWDVIVGD